MLKKDANEYDSDFEREVTQRKIDEQIREQMQVV